MSSPKSRRKEVRSEKRSDPRVDSVESLFQIHSKLFDCVSLSLRELKATLSKAEALEEDLKKNDIRTNLVSEIKHYVNQLSGLKEQLKEAQISLHNEEKDYAKQFKQIQTGLDSAILPIGEALKLSLELDRSSRSGYNLEYQMFRRLGVREIIKTIGVAYNQLTRLSRLSTAKVSSYRRGMSFFLEDNDRGF